MTKQNILKNTHAVKIDYTTANRQTNKTNFMVKVMI